MGPSFWLKDFLKSSKLTIVKLLVQCLTIDKLLTYLRILFSFASTLDLEIHQMDVHVDFLNGTLHEEIFMQQPKGYIQKGFENKVC